MDDAERDRLLALLEANHRFPGPFFLSVVAHSGDEVAAAIHAAVREIAGDVPDDAWEARASSGGRYHSHRVTVTVDSATQALALYARLREVPGVVTIL